MDDHAGDRIRIRKRQTLSDNWFRLENVTFEQVRGDGSCQTLQREVYHNGPGAAVLPMDAARSTVLLVRQLRIPACVNGDNPMLVELCAGMIEAGSNPAETARKEAEQELGYRLRNLRQVFVLYPSPESSAEKLHLFVAAYGPDDRIGAGGGLAGEGERIQCLELPLDHVWSMVEAGEIIDAKTVLMLQHVRLNSQ